MPSEAEATIDIRLVPGQDPMDIFEKIRKYVEKISDGSADVILMAVYNHQKQI